MPEAHKRLPSIFFGHGNPLFAIEPNPYAEEWSKLGASLPRPKAILAISAHWYVPAALVTGSEAPRTIHDFGGFPEKLYQVQYPVRGDLALAQRVRQLLAPEVEVALDEGWGVDHGTWSVLRHVFPQADVPVVQLSIDARRTPAFHYQAGKRLAPLRDEGVLMMGSGNIVHNLRSYAWGRQSVAAFDWAVRFEQEVRELLLSGTHGPLIDYESLGADAARSAPTPEHYLPLLYVIATQQDGDAVSFPIEGVDGGSISMLAVRIG